MEVKIMKFYVTVEEMRATLVEVEANDADEALDKVNAAYDNGVFVLTKEDVECIETTDETEYYQKSVEEGVVIPHKV
jgi:hypothetical protein